MKLSRSLSLGVLTVLAVPAAAFAHPAVYTSEQFVLRGSDACAIPVSACLTDEPRITYAVANDGYAMGFTEGTPTVPAGLTTETNGAPAGRGLINYRFLPGTWRGAATPENRALWLQQPEAQTDVQAHATCLGAGWDTPANVLAWQEDPFYNYIPWQKTSVGIGDDPAKWIVVVKQVTGVDLATLNTEADFTQACTTAGGTYYKADAASKITNSLETSIRTPLESQITTLTASVSTLTAAKAAVDAQLAAALAPKPARALTLRLSAKKFDQGVAMVTGEPNTAVKVKALLSSANAKKLKISRTISSKSVKIDATGAALVDLGLSKKAAKAIDKHLPSLKVTIEAAAGTTKKVATGTLTR